MLLDIKQLYDSIESTRICQLVAASLKCQQLIKLSTLSVN